MFGVLVAMTATVAGVMLVARPAAAAPAPIFIATHAVVRTNFGAMNHVLNTHVGPVLSIGLQEVCQGDVGNEDKPLFATLKRLGYRLWWRVSTNAAANGCKAGERLVNVVATLAYDFIGPTGNYNAQIGNVAPKEWRSYACILGNFGRQWVSCSTQLEFRVNSSGVPQVSLQQQSQLRTVMSGESNLRIKIMMGDFNVRPNNASANYVSYREADQFASTYNSTRNPPSAYPNQKVDYIFADRFWTNDMFGYQDRRCATASDHCLIIGGFMAA